MKLLKLVPDHTNIDFMRWRNVALVLSIIVSGLPAYVMIKVLTPGFYARKDMKTPVVVAFISLVIGVTANFILIPIMGIAALATTTAPGTAPAATGGGAA